MRSRTAAAGRRRTRRLVAACAVSAALATGAPAEAAPPRVANGVLRGVTTITWSGIAGIRLRVPKQVLIEESGYRLTQRGARFMFVRMMPVSELAQCRKRQPCSATALDWLADLAETGGNLVAPPPYDPGADHFASLWDPPIVPAGGWDLYLFTDGVATLEIRPKGLSGRAAYRAGGVVTGRAKRLPARCPVSPCDPQKGVGGVYAFGGETYDVGTIGYAQAIAYVQKEPRFTAATGHQQPTFARACPYPNRYDPDASREPENHPYGCDPLPEHPNQSGEWSFGFFNQVGTGGNVMFSGDTHASGRTYLGYQAGTKDLYAATGDPPARYGGYGVWFRYGIRGAT